MVPEAFRFAGVQQKNQGDSGQVGFLFFNFIANVYCYNVTFVSRISLNHLIHLISPRFDVVVDGIIKQRQEERRKNKETGTAKQFKDMLDVLLDMHEDENAEIKLDKKNIKAFIMVSQYMQFFFFYCFRQIIFGHSINRADTSLFICLVTLHHYSSVYSLLVCRCLSFIFLSCRHD